MREAKRFFPNTLASHLSHSLLGDNSQSQNVESLNSVLQATVSSVRGAVVVTSVTAVVLGRKDEVGQPQIREDEVERQKVAAIALESWSEHREEVKEEGYNSLLFFISIYFSLPIWAV